MGPTPAIKRIPPAETQGLLFLQPYLLVDTVTLVTQRSSD
jgi:hypothetical protein